MSRLLNTIDDALKRCDCSGDCWIWQRHTKGGCGRISCNGVVMNAQAAVWIWTYGPVPPKRRVVQSCSNKLCCNPAHLALAVKHQPDTRAVLNAEVVLEIFALQQSKRRRKDIARQFGVCTSALTQIWRGKSWVSVTKPNQEQNRGQTSTF